MAAVAAAAAPLSGLALTRWQRALAALQPPGDADLGMLRQRFEALLEHHPEAGALPAGPDPTRYGLNPAAVFS
jgi:hypothetical protein